MKKKYDVLVLETSEYLCKGIEANSKEEAEEIAYEEVQYGRAGGGLRYKFKTKRSKDVRNTW